MNICAKAARVSGRVSGGGGGGGTAAAMLGGSRVSWGLDQGLSVLQMMSEDGLEADVVLLN